MKKDAEFLGVRKEVRKVTQCELFPPPDSDSSIEYIGKIISNNPAFKKKKSRASKGADVSAARSKGGEDGLQFRRLGPKY